jgi:hypothetical protein
MFGSMLMINSLISGFQLIKVLIEQVDAEKLIRRYSMLEHAENVTLTQWCEHFVQRLSLSFSLPSKLSTWSWMPPSLWKFTFVHDGQVPVKQRYTLFMITHLVSMVGHILFWESFWPCFLTDSILLIIALPVTTVLITSSTLWQLVYQYCIGNVVYTIVYAITLTMTKIMNALISTLTMDYVPVEHYEILKLYHNDYTFSNRRGAVNGTSRTAASAMSGGSMTFVFFKTVISQSVLHYLKKGRHGVYAYILDVSHRYQLGGPSHVTDMFLNKRELLERQVKDLTKMINERRWHDFIQSKTIAMLFEIYDNRNTTMYAVRIGNMVKEVQLNFMRFTTLWTFSAFAMYNYEFTAAILIMTDIYFAFFSRRYLCQQHPLAYLLAAIVFGATIVTSAGNSSMMTCAATWMLVFSSECIEPFLKLASQHQIVQRFFINTWNQFGYIMLVGFTVGFVNITSPFVAAGLLYFQLDHATLTASITAGAVTAGAVTPFASSSVPTLVTPIVIPSSVAPAAALSMHDSKEENSKNVESIVADVKPKGQMSSLQFHHFGPSIGLISTSLLSFISRPLYAWIHASLSILIFICIYNTVYQIQQSNDDDYDNANAIGAAGAASRKNDGNQKLIIDTYSTKTPEYEAFYREQPTLRLDHHHDNDDFKSPNSQNNVKNVVNMSPLSLPPPHIASSSSYSLTYSPLTTVATRHVSNICSNLSRYFKSS